MDLAVIGFREGVGDLDQAAPIVEIEDIEADNEKFVGDGELSEPCHGVFPQEYAGSSAVTARGSADGHRVRVPADAPGPQRWTRTCSLIAGTFSPQMWA